MPMTPIRLYIDADDVSLPLLAESLSAFRNVLQEVDKSVAGGHSGTLEWLVVSLKAGGSATIEAVAEPREAEADNGPTVIRACVTGFRILDQGPTAVESFTDEALEQLKRLATLVTGEVRGFRVTAPSLNETATITQRTVANIVSLAGLGWYSIGSVEGRLETVSIHGQPTFTIYDALTSRAVRCEFEPDFLRRALDSVGARVLVHGRLQRDARGRPVRLRDIDAFRVLDAPSSIDVFIGLLKPEPDAPTHLKRLRA